jgi:hypothetical protein
MRLSKWITGELLALGAAFTEAQRASAYTVADLDGTWTDT